MTLEAFRAFTQVVVGCEYMVRPVCFLILWDVFCRPDRDRADLAAAGLVLLLNAVWWFAEPPLSFRVMLAALVLGYCHVGYGRGAVRAAVGLLRVRVSGEGRGRVGCCGGLEREGGVTG